MENFCATTVGEAMTNSQTTLRVKAGTGGSFIEPPALLAISRSRNFRDLLNSEVISIDSRVLGDNDLFNITRNVDGRGASTHEAGELVLANIFAEHFATINEVYELVAYAFGLEATAVIQTTIDRSGDLKVSQNSTPDMTVQIAAGMALINRVLSKLSIAGSLSFTAPTSAARTDVVCLGANGVPEIVAGTEGGGVPSVPSTVIALAQVALTVGQTSIVTGDITDVRTFY